MSMKVWDSALALPKDIDDAEQLLTQLETLQQPPNPKFISLAQALLADSAFAGHWGTERILEEAENCVYAIWEPNLPAGDAMPAIRAVIQHATALGLVAYRASRQAVFLPSGATVTPEQKALHDEDFAAYDSRLRARAEVCQTLLKGFTEHFAPFGFAPSHLDSSEIHRFAALSLYDRHLAEFSRPIHDGWQRLVVSVNHHDADSPYFNCGVSFGVRSEPVEAIFTQVFGAGIRRIDTFVFCPAILQSANANSFEITSALLVQELPALVERLAMPIVNLTCDLAGLNEVMNTPSRFPFPYPLNPQAPQNIADEFLSLGRQSCLKTLIVAWLARSPDFENRVASLRDFVKKRVDVSEGDLQRLLADLATMPL